MLSKRNTVRSRISVRGSHYTRQFHVANCAAFLAHFKAFHRNANINKTTEQCRFVHMQQLGTCKRFGATQ